MENFGTATSRNPEALVMELCAQVPDLGQRHRPHESLLEALDTSGNMAAFRYSVEIGEDQKMKLAVIGLPAVADTFQGKPLHRG